MVKIDPKPEWPIYAELVVSDTPVGLGDATPPLPDNCSRAYIGCEDAAVRWRADGTMPTASAGHQILKDDSVSFTNRDYMNLLNHIRFIRVTTDAKLTITYDP
jgi:hypothetical protein